MKKILLTILPLLLIVGCSKVEGKQDLIPVVETYDNGNIKSITYHKKSRTEIEKVKYEGYHKNGQKKEEGTYKDGKEDGKWTEWHQNGQKWEEGTYKDGKADGKWTEWYENGEKWKEGTCKDGKKDGLWTEWHENGQKMYEKTYKDGYEISIECWDQDGNETDCPRIWY